MTFTFYLCAFWSSGFISSFRRER